MNAQLTGNGADFPVLDVKVAANLRARVSGLIMK
jgi:hypothetical protein